MKYLSFKIMDGVDSGFPSENLSCESTKRSCAGAETFGVHAHALSDIEVQIAQRYFVVLFIRHFFECPMLVTASSQNDG